MPALHRSSILALFRKNTPKESEPKPVTENDARTLAFLTPSSSCDTLVEDQTPAPARSPYDTFISRVKSDVSSMLSEKIQTMRWKVPAGVSEGTAIAGCRRLKGVKFVVERVGDFVYILGRLA
ncbi:hypothetical protein HDU85_000536 [Gaertneriomyces sp. JEL0708]|nr:hypothetical protein HDU85_000536 [Gaertneriomyces sp. JEL0708]